MKNQHQELCLRAEKWLKAQGCSVIIRDPFRCPINKEQPDAIGWRDGLSILIEVKTSRSDYFAESRKRFRSNALGMGNWRFYLCPPDIITASDLLDGWGLLYATNKTIRKVHGVPPNTAWWTKRPFEANLEAEHRMLTSALRRFSRRGLMKTIYLHINEQSIEE